VITDTMVPQVKYPGYIRREPMYYKQGMVQGLHPGDYDTEQNFVIS